MVTEDPSYMYDEDGFCVDEDQDWEDYEEPNGWADIDGDLAFVAPSLAPQKVQEELSPFSTINS